MMDDKALGDIKNRLQLQVECVCCCESVECLSDCTLADDSPEGYERLRADREATATHRAAVQEAYYLGRAVQEAYDLGRAALRGEGEK